MVPAGSDDVPEMVGVSLLMVPKLSSVITGARVSISPAPAALPVFPAASVLPAASVMLAVTPAMILEQAVLTL